MLFVAYRGRELVARPYPGQPAWTAGLEDGRIVDAVIGHLDQVGPGLLDDLRARVDADQDDRPAEAPAETARRLGCTAQWVETHGRSLVCLDGTRHRPGRPCVITNPREHAAALRWLSITPLTVRPRP